MQVLQVPYVSIVIRSNRMSVTVNLPNCSPFKTACLKRLLLAILLHRKKDQTTKALFWKVDVKLYHENTT